MIMPSDKDYQETKQIMLGKAAMKQEFVPLADWIYTTYGVKPINIVYDTIDDGKRPRLEICLEFERDRARFNTATSYSFDSDKQQAIADQFRLTLQEQGLLASGGIFDLFGGKYSADNLWVIYGAFEPVAKDEANQCVSQEAVMGLKAELNDPYLWEISRAFSGVTFFLFTDAQLKRYESSAARKEWTDKYFELLKPHDVFGYYKREHFSVYLDSKENFDNNYASNWYYYYK